MRIFNYAQLFEELFYGCARSYIEQNF